MSLLRRAITARMLCGALLMAGCTNEGVREANARVEVDARASFGTVFAGSVAEATFRILSTGSAPVRVTGIDVSTPALAVADDPLGALAGGSARVVTLRWRPDAPGTLEASVSLSVEADELRAFTVTVTGEAIALPSCDDGNSCTDGVFDADLGRCVFTPREGTCDDGNACTSGDRCAEGVCVGVAVTCNDDDVCTRDVCEPATGCVFLPDETVCDDGDPCTRDVCEGEGACSHPPMPDRTWCGPMTCAELNVCIGGRCRTFDISGDSDGEACDDGDRCTANDACLAGECVGEFTPRGPELLSDLPVVGGPEALVGTDGIHLLVHDQGLLYVATRNAEGQFRFRSKTEVALSTAPVALSTGRFVAGQEEALLFIDVSQPATPTVTRRTLGGEARILRVLPASGGLLVHRAAHEEELVHVALDPTLQPGAVTSLLGGWVMDFAVAGNQLVYSGSGGAWWALIDFTSGPQPRLTRITNLSPRFARVDIDGDRIALDDGTLTIGRVAQVPADDPIACDGQGPCRSLGPACEKPDAFEAGLWRLCGLDGSCPSGTSCQERVVDLCPTCEDCANNQTTVWQCVRKQRTVFDPLSETLSQDPFPVAADVALGPAGGAWVGSTAGGARRYAADGRLEALVAPHNPNVEVVGNLVLLSGGERLRVLELRDGTYVDVAPDGLGAFTQVLPGKTGVALLGGTHAVAELELASARLSSWHSTLSEDEAPACRRAMAGPGGYAMTVEQWPWQAPACDATRLDVFDAKGERLALHPEGLEVSGTTLVTGQLFWQFTDSLQLAWRLDDFEPAPAISLPLTETFSWASGDDAGERVLLLRSPWNELPIARIVDPPWHTPNASTRFTLEGAPEGVEGLRLSGDSLLGSDSRALMLWRAGEPQPAARLEVDQRVNASPRWLSPTHAWVSLSDEPAVAQVGHDASTGRLEWLGQVPLPAPARALRPVGDTVVVVHDRGTALIAPACE